MIDEIRNWSDANPFLAHLVFLFLVGAAGAKVMLWAGGSLPWALANGAILAIAVITSQEWTDRRVSVAFQRWWKRLPNRHSDGPWSGFTANLRQRPTIWHDWSWKDWAGGVVGGFLGALFTCWRAM